ncbi:ROK family protein [Phycicoccus sp. 3266]|uniref:ROK family transcriptional regulator n=1 Tax=Phycicoccus sp. 3266 TaxID=2817751 RepID=UPI00286A689C|nr:ROK family protein [Phycicoccus sp. 3266]
MQLSTGASSAQRVLAHLLGQVKPVTRPEMALACELSRPTVLAAVERLEELGLVAALGQRSGLPGRSATLYEVPVAAGVVAAVDIGGSNLRVALTDARGNLLVESRDATSVSGGPAITARAAELLHKAYRDLLDPGPMGMVAVSVPGVVAADGKTVHYAWNVGQPEPFDFHTPLAQALEVPVLLDNNVNLAAIGELWQGAAQDLDTFAVIAVGAGVGAGLVHNGDLLRGAHGAAGEVASLPLSAHFRPQQAGSPDEAGGIMLLRAAQDRKDWGRQGPPASVEELYVRAAHGEAPALALVEEESRRIALIAASICAVIDPEAIILTGGVGANETLVKRTGQLVAELAPFPPEVLRSALGDRASLVGAIAVGIRAAQAGLISLAGEAPSGSHVLSSTPTWPSPVRRLRQD